MSRNLNENRTHKYNNLNNKKKLSANVLNTLNTSSLNVKMKKKIKK